MPNYPYQCEQGHRWEVVKSIADIDAPEACPECSSVGSRYIGRTWFYGASDWDKAHFNVGLGCECRSHKHALQIAKSRGLEEVGNTKPDTIHEHGERTRKDKWERSWAEV